MKRRIQLDDLCDMFDEYIDGIYEPFVLDDIKIPASEILKERPWAYDKQFEKYIKDFEVGYVNLGDDSYYTINVINEEDY